MKGLSKDEARVLRRALLPHDGASLAPNWDRDKHKDLTAALNKIRGILWNVYEPVK